MNNDHNKITPYCPSVILTIICLLGMFWVGCWNRQDHDITRPLVPHYLFNGTTIDIDTAEPLPGTQIMLQEVTMLYEAEFGTQIVTADSTGFFQFDSVFPGDYYLSMERNGYFINYTKLTIPHKDSTTVLEIPKIMYANVFSSINTCLAISSLKAWTLNRDYSADSWEPNASIVEHKFEHNRWLKRKYYNYTFSVRKIYSMAFGRDGVYCTLYPDSVYMFNFYDASIASDFAVGVNVKGITLHIAQQSLYSCAGENIYRHDKEKPSQIAQTFITNYESLRALAFNKNLYAWDDMSHCLLKLDDDINTIETFALVTDSTSQITKVYDMDFDGYGNFWVTGVKDQY